MVVLTFGLVELFVLAFRIPSESMVPTLLKGDFLFVNKFEYGPKIPFTHIRLPGLRPPHRGDVIVFRSEERRVGKETRPRIAPDAQTKRISKTQVTVDWDT